ncbi:hypothetical protein G9A89_021488 [Geosiphon pyriformis]|nr:hypothetical protein G9A89_021488 [Geosiphon pyriformis]
MTTKETKVKVGVLTISDTATANPSKDLSGPALKNLLEEYRTDKTVFCVTATACVPDELERIQQVVKTWCDTIKLDLVITTGGTGFGIRDITPEAINPLIQKHSPGITHAMISASLLNTPFAALSRPVSGIRGNTIILTVPGSPKGAKENLQAVLNILPHAIELANGGSGENIHSGFKDSERVVSVPGDNTVVLNHRCVHRERHEHDDNHRNGDQKELILSKSPSTPVSQRHRQSPYPMLSVEEAMSIIDSYTNVLGTIELPVDNNLIGHVFAKDVPALENVPGYRASIVDGYAVIASDGPGIYKVKSVSLADASDYNETLESGQIVRITTGGSIPNGATAVVMVEDTNLIRATLDGIQEELVEILVQSCNGENIREVGSDTKIGETVVHANEIASAVGGEIGVLASVGITKVLVYQHPKLGILSTGDEVVDYNNSVQLKNGEIRDCNRPTLLAIAKATGFEMIDFGIVPDNPQEIERRLRLALSQVDVLITTGGVSMGEKDLLKPTLEHSLGAKIHFGRVKIKPGKPTTFATLQEPKSLHKFHKLIFSLPGNPVSAIVMFYFFVLPALRKMAGYQTWKWKIVSAELSHKVILDPRPEYQRATISFDHLTRKLIARSTGLQQSSRMQSFQSCNALLVLPAGTNQLRELNQGQIVNAILIGQLN